MPVLAVDLVLPGRRDKPGENHRQADLQSLAETRLRDLHCDHFGAAVLTVADRFDFPELGGDIGLELVGGRVSFSINRRKTVRGDLTISSKLMRLASEVK